LIVRWSPDAEIDRQEIWEYIAEHDRGAADRMDIRFEEASNRLADFPHLGRPGVFVGSRELIPHRNYRMVYVIRDDTIWIVALLHTARQWPPVTDD
jgi:plasmid stabilization system protein ParE